MDDTLYDGRWQFIGCHYKKYQFKNIYNEQVVEVGERTYKNIVSGKDTISHHISRIIPTKTSYIHNSIQTRHRYRKAYFAKK